MTNIPFRCVILEDGDGIGQPDGRHRFHLHWQFLQQLDMMLTARWGWKLKQLVPAGQAVVLADMIDGLGDDPAWTVHMATWNTSRRRAVRSLAAFLRRGGFVIVKPGKRESQRAAVLQFQKHFKE